MAVIREIIERVDASKPNEFDARTKLRWVAELDGVLALDVFLLASQELARVNYRYPEDLESEALVDFPFDSLYDAWLEARIDYSNGEYDRYANSMQMYNARYTDFNAWFAKVYNPAGNHGEAPRHYLSAYGIACKHGFTGTEAEWIMSLGGPVWNGKSVELRCQDDTIQWRWTAEQEDAAGQWKDLLTLAEVRGQTFDEAVTAALEAGKAAGGSAAAAADSAKTAENAAGTASVAVNQAQRAAELANQYAQDAKKYADAVGGSTGGSGESGGEGQTQPEQAKEGQLELMLGAGYKIRLGWQQVMNSSAGTSKVIFQTAQLYAETYDDGRCWPHGKILVDGVQVVNMDYYNTATHRAAISPYKQWADIKPQVDSSAGPPWETGDLAHGEDGSKTITVRVEGMELLGEYTQSARALGNAEGTITLAPVQEAQAQGLDTGEQAKAQLLTILRNATYAEGFDSGTAIDLLAALL